MANRYGYIKQLISTCSYLVYQQERCEHDFTGGTIFLHQAELIALEIVDQIEALQDDIANKD